MELTRREFVIASAALVLAPRVARAGLSTDLVSALETSPLIYITPLKRDGSESRCHAEVWFAKDGESALVITGFDRWRAVAIGKGLTKARLWVGDHGVWGSSDAWKQAPSSLADATLETQASAHEHALSLFGSKYTREWSSWGPRFKNGLADGSRVLIRYRPTSA